MSLKGFHLVFMTLCLLLFGFLVAWGFFFSGEDGLHGRALGLTGVGGLVLLPFYGVYFLRKAKRINL